jgi:hypothetical protein
LNGEKPEYGSTAAKISVSECIMADAAARAPRQMNGDPEADTGSAETLGSPILHRAQSESSNLEDAAELGSSPAGFRPRIRLAPICSASLMEARAADRTRVPI